MKSISLMFGAALLSTACASFNVIGDQPAATPPQLIRLADGRVVWDKPGAFGPVPAELAAKGAAVCKVLNTDKESYKVLGFHPSARDLLGNTIAQGGFYCEKE